MRLVKKHWPLLLAIGLLWAALAFALHDTYRYTGGRLIYALDDPYIHMSVAKNVAEYGVWGVTRYEFSSSTSSVLWPLLLTLEYALSSPNEISAFVWNALFATLTLAVAYAFLRHSGLKRPSGMLLALLGIAFFTPFPALIFIGMEHALHAFVETVFWVLCARQIAQPGRRGLLWLASGAFIVCLTRYESAFTVLTVCLLLFVRRRFRDGIVVGLMGLLPMIGYGLISLSQGWFFLPNSLYLRGPDVDPWMKFLQVMQTLFTVPDFSLLVLVGVLLAASRVLRRNCFAWTPPVVALIIFASAATIHLLAARTGWFYRYEAYLIALGIMVIAAALAEKPPHLAVGRGARHAAGLSLVATISVAGILALAVRGVNSYREIPRAVANIYEQQYQMGLFLREYYAGAGVVANDIGAINYLADIRNLDIYGLGSLEILQAKQQGRYDTAEISRLAADAQIAIVYEAWFDPYGGVPPGWILVGQWTIPGNIVAALDTVAFYAIDPAQADALAEHLRAFSTQLPPEVVQEGAYLVAAR